MPKDVWHRVKRFAGAVFVDVSTGRWGPKGFLVDRGLRVGDGIKGISSSESDASRWILANGGDPGSWSNIEVVFAVGALVPLFRRGDKDRDAIAMGDGDAISISMAIGVPS